MPLLDSILVGPYLYQYYRYLKEKIDNTKECMPEHLSYCEQYVELQPRHVYLRDSMFIHNFRLRIGREPKYLNLNLTKTHRKLWHSIVFL